MVKLEIKKSIQRGLFKIYIVLGAAILRTLRIVYTKHSQWNYGNR